MLTIKNLKEKYIIKFINLRPLMIKKKKILELYLIMQLYLLIKKEIAEDKLKQNYKNKLMKDSNKSLSQSQEILINMKIGVKLRLLKSYNKYNQ